MCDEVLSTERCVNRGLATVVVGCPVLYFSIVI